MKIYTVTATCKIASLVGELLKGSDPLEKRIVFCEDKFTLQLELAIAKALKGTFGTNVFSFNRFMHSHLSKNQKVLSPEGCALVIKGLLLENKDSLQCFKNVYDPNLASTIYELIAQLKSAKVTPLDIERAWENTTGNLKRKLKDIHLLFSGYENYIKEHSLTDGNNRLSDLTSFFASDEEIKDTHVIVAGFPSLNRTLCEIFKALNKNAKSLTFVVVAGDNKGVYTNETFNFVMDNFKVEHISKEEDSPNNFMLKRLYAPSSKGVEGKYSNKIHLYRAKNVQEEIEHVAEIIKNGVINGARYKDYSLAIENLQPYELILKRIFSDFEIPLFCDISKDLGKHPLTRLMCSYIDVVRRNFDPDDVLNFVKNPLFTVDKLISDGFENYFIKCGINRKTIKMPFTEEDENLELYESIRQKVVGLCGNFPSKPTFSRVIDEVINMLEKVDAFNNLELLNGLLDSEKDRDLISVNEQIKDKVDGVISDCISILGEKILPLKEVKNIILTGMTSCKVSVILESSDCVFAGDFKSMRYQESKNLFALGLTDGVPSSKLDSALLCDRDISKMEKSKVLVEPKIKEVNRRSRETCCMALATFKDNLYLSYPVKSVDNESVMPSELLSYVMAIFSEKSKNKVTCVYDEDKYRKDFELLGKEREKNYLARKYISSRRALFAFAKDTSDFKEGAINNYTTASTYYKYIKEKDDGKIASGILNSANSEVGYYTSGVDYAQNGLSATAIEGYFNCPYSNFLSRGLKLTEREEGKIRANDLGTMIHAVAEIFVKKVNWEMTTEEVVLLAMNIFDEVSSSPLYSRYTKTESGKRSFEYIGKETLDFCLNIFESSKHSSLKPKYVEVAFGKGGVSPITVDTDFGKMQVNGKVDRIDTDDKYMRIIDYKTGHVDTAKDDKLFYMGKKLQLYLYAQAFSENYQPIGVYYFPVNGDFVNSDQENIMQLKGKTIADIEKASLVDDTISESEVKGTYVNANLYMNKNGSFRSKSTLLSENEFADYMDYAVKIAGAGLNEIKSGVIIPSPVKDSCSYCKYKGICGYNSAIDERDRDFSTIEKKHILHAVHGEPQEDAEGEED